MENLAFYGSDHRPILLCLKPILLPHLKKALKRFTFEQNWLLEDDFSEFFSQTWTEGRGIESIPARLHQCSGILKSWAGQRFDKLGSRIKVLRKELDRLMDSNMVINNQTRILELEKNIEKLSDQEEIYLNQRSRVNWLKHGDRNTKFFHASASKRCKVNNIKGLMNGNGEWCTDMQSLIDITSEYFVNLFSSSHPSDADIEVVLNFYDPVVGDRMNEYLCAPFSEDEVHKAVFDMHPSKAPGPDGFTALFYQKFWTVIGNDITKVVLSILNGQLDPLDWNATLITLIPKIKEPVHLKD